MFVAMMCALTDMLPSVAPAKAAINAAVSTDKLNIHRCSKALFPLVVWFSLSEENPWVLGGTTDFGATTIVPRSTLCTHQRTKKI